MALRNRNGNIMVKLLISLISVSVISTALLNLQQSAVDNQGSGEISAITSVRAKSALDEICYHLKLAGYGNTTTQIGVEVARGERSDTLVVRHNDLEIVFFVDDASGQLCEISNGTIKKVADGAESLRLVRSQNDLADVHLTLVDTGERGPSSIVSRSYSTTVRLKDQL